MNINQFNEQVGHLKDVDQIPVDPLCDHSEHVSIPEKTIGRGAARRNILKNGGKRFICRECYMKHCNPMNKMGPNRQTDEEIVVICHHLEHEGDRKRKMKMSHYYGEMKEPYEQTCGSCAQRGKVISEEQKKAISKTLEGRKLTDSHRKHIGEAVKRDPERIEKAIKNLKPWLGSGWNKGKKTPKATKDKISAANKGLKRTKKQRKNISRGRKKMIAEQGGFTQEHREKISEAVVRQYEKGFEPKLHHRRGWHYSPKLKKKVYYRSSYEKKAYMLLDADDSVKRYEVESVKIKYWNPKKKINSTFLVDIQVFYKDGRESLVEVKPTTWLKDIEVQAKITAGSRYAAQQECSFEMWDEIALFGPVNTFQKIKLFVESLD